MSMAEMQISGYRPFLKEERPAAIVAHGFASFQNSVFLCSVRTYAVP
jgi:hypothetical protein